MPPLAAGGGRRVRQSARRGIAAAGAAATRYDVQCAGMDCDWFHKAIEAFDQIHGEDPQQEAGRPAELVYAERVSAWVRRLAPDASPELLLAARCQHIRRWAVPRSSYPEGRAGYLQWRRDLAQRHADTASAVLRAVGCDELVIARVRDLNLKRELRSDPEVQILEDALCLVFLEHQFAATTGKTGDNKMISILRKTWSKMSPAGRAAARALPLGSREAELLREALPPSPVEQ